MFKKLLIVLALSLGLSACQSQKIEKQDVSAPEEETDFQEVKEKQSQANTANLDQAEEESEKSEETEAYIRDPALLEEKVLAYLDQMGIDPSYVGLAYKNLNDGMSYGLNNDQVFLAGSTSKVPIVMFLFDLANEGQIDLDQTLYIGENHMEDGTGVLYYDSYPGAAYSLYELAELMITVSDNTATNMIYGFLGQHNGEYLLDSLHRVYGISSYNGNYMTPDDAIMVLERTYYNEVGNPLYEDLLNFMKSTIYNDYATALIESGEIAHKTGDYEGYFNDIAIVYEDASDYAFAIYTNNLADPIPTLQDLGLIIHNWHTGQEEDSDDL